MIRSNALVFYKMNFEKFKKIAHLRNSIIKVFVYKIKTTYVCILDLNGLIGLITNVNENRSYLK